MWWLLSLCGNNPKSKYHTINGKQILKHFVLLYVISAVAGRVITIIRLPPLVGMIMAGIGFNAIESLNSNHQFKDEFILLFIYTVWYVYNNMYFNRRNDIFKMLDNKS